MKDPRSITRLVSVLAVAFSPTLTPLAQGQTGTGASGGSAKRLRIAQDPESRLEETAEGLAPPGGLYGVDSSTTPPSDQPEAPKGPVPEFDIVEKGDTLWSLCQEHFGDPWRWPKLWAQNPLITNPHWIFPGDIVRLREPGPGGPELAAAPAADPMGLGGSRTGRDDGAVVLRTVGFIEAKHLAEAGFISGSREEKIMLATGDQVYLGGKAIKAGERYTVFETRKDHPVRDPETGAVLGYIVHIFGDVTVDQVTAEGVARGALVDMMEGVERNYLVSPFIKQFKRIERRPSTVSLSARIVASLSPGNLLAPEMFVVLSRGKKDGVAVGNRSFVVRQTDGSRRILESWEKFDPKYPKEVVGELLVVDVRENAAIAWVARSSKELRVGEVIEMRKGY